MKQILLMIFYLISIDSFAWQVDLEKEIEKINHNFNGEIGVVIRNLKDGSQLEYNAKEKWYLSSTMKVLVGISLLEEVEKGKIDLNQKIGLKENNFVDGAGTLIWKKPGDFFSIAYLLQVMLRESDNTATDILIELIGKEELNRDIKKWMPEAGMATSLLDVRYLTYRELHPKASNLNNMDFILLKNIPLESRHKFFAKKINVPLKDLKAKSLEDAQEKFYARGYNSSTLQSYVDLLEKLEKGKLLSNKNTALLLSHMEHMKNGDHRIKAGLTTDYKFFQKTGTQINRACNMGLIRKSAKQKSDIAIAVCIKKPSENINSDEVFKIIGQKLVESLNSNQRAIIK